MTVVPQGVAYRDFEHAAWERAAAHYSDSFAASTRLFSEPLLDAVQIAPGLTLLDLACGPGLVSGIAAARGAVVKGLDFSAAMVAEARLRHPTLEFVRGDADALPFEDGTFDRVVCGFGVHHFPSPVRALAEVHRVLKPGGRCAFTVWASDEHVPQQLLVSTVRAYGNAGTSLPTAPHGDINSIEACLALLHAAGFSERLSVASKLRSVLRLASMSDMIEMMLKGTARSSALLQSQPPEAMAAIHAGLEQAAARYRRDQAYELPAAAVLATACKT